MKDKDEEYSKNIVQLSDELHLIKVYIEAMQSDLTKVSLYYQYFFYFLFDLFNSFKCLPKKHF